MKKNVPIFQVQYHGRSEVGLVRDNNEDTWLAEPKSNVFVLCDGMGGHAAGEIASREAAAVFSSLLKQHQQSKKPIDIRAPEVMQDLIQKVNASVFALGQQDQQLKGMGTTFCCVYFQSASMIVGHVGDSRVYLMREKELVQLTKDHSLVAELMELGELNTRQAREFAHRNIITRAIGTEPRVDPAVQVCSLAPGDQILMCSDGLTDMLSGFEIERTLNTSKTVESKVDHLINKAIRKGGHDNITVILMKVQGNL